MAGVLHCGKVRWGCTLGLSSERQPGVKPRPSIAPRQPRADQGAMSVPTTFPRLLLAARRAAARRAGAAREGVRHLADAHAGRSWPQLVRAARLRPAPRPGLQRGEHLVVVGENRPRLYASMLAAQSLGAMPVPLYQDAAAAEFVFPINNAEVALRDRRGPGAGRQAARGARAVPAARAHLVRRPARPAQLPASRAWPSLDALIEAGPRLRRARNPGFFDAEVAQGRARRRGGDVLHLGHHRQPQGRGAHAPHAARPRRAPAPRSTSSPRDEEVLAYLPPAWIGQNIFSYAQWLACGYVVNCPESAAHGDDRPEGDRARPTTSRRRASSRAC